MSDSYIFFKVVIRVGSSSFNSSNEDGHKSSSSESELGLGTDRTKGSSSSDEEEKQREWPTLVSFVRTNLNAATLLSPSKTPVVANP